MARPIPDSRLGDLLRAATGVFVAQGYRRTQMADVAAAAGLSKGTVYLAFESKQALFHAALVHADGEAPLASQVELPMTAFCPSWISTSVLSLARGVPATCPLTANCMSLRRMLRWSFLGTTVIFWNPN